MSRLPRKVSNLAVIRKVPERMCIGCQSQHPKKEMIRIVRSPEGEFSVDPTGKNQDAARIFVTMRLVLLKL